ncbi:hypothetical protein [Pectinatus frisingensis]|uniref:hypothetical protein n=1 Tax=Pectinatus frisingensis TaxID=865 RepID=UPI0018C74615|nr:hypothetical protein [Pectinatus frisingensis]
MGLFGFGSNNKEPVVSTRKKSYIYGGSSDPENIRNHLIKTFGTPDLNAVLEFGSL